MVENNPKLTSHNGQVAVELIIEQCEAALREHLLSIHRCLSTSLFMPYLAAGVRNSSSQLSHILPVCIGVDATAVQALLDQVPGGSDAIIALLVIVFLALFHILADLSLQRTPQGKSSDTSSNLDKNTSVNFISK